MFRRSVMGCISRQQKVGGAPLNVAYLNSAGVNTNCIIASAKFPTGIVDIQLSPQEYVISEVNKLTKTLLKKMKIAIT